MEAGQAILAGRAPAVRGVRDRWYSDGRYRSGPYHAASWRPAEVLGHRQLAVDVQGAP